MNKDQAAQVALYGRLLAFNSVEKANGASADDVSHILADLQAQVPGSTEVQQPVVTPDKRSLWQVIGDFLSQFKKG